MRSHGTYQPPGGMIVDIEAGGEKDNASKKVRPVREAI